MAPHRSVRYAPEVEVRHPPRPTLRARARQHFDYGTSAATLEERHPGSVAPLRPNRMMVPAALLAGGSATGALLAGGAIAAAAGRRRGDARARLAVAGLAVENEMLAGRELARAVSRDWLSLSIGAALRVPRARRLVLAAVLADLLVAVAPAPAPANVALRLVDNAAYCLGLWHGAWTRRSASALLPDHSCRLSQEKR